MSLGYRRCHLQEKKNLVSLLDELRELCATQCSGTSLILAAGNNIAQFVLDKGEIVALAYNSKRGADALPLIRQITMGSTRFVQNALLSGTTPLVPTAVLLNALGKSATAPARPPTSSGMQGVRIDRTHEVRAGPSVQVVQSSQAGQEAVTAPVGGRVAVCQLMSEVMNSLIERFGDHGFGRDNLVKVLGHRLRRLQTQYPFLAQVGLMTSKIDFTPLVASSAPVESLAQAWSTLIQEVYQSGLDNIGLKKTQEYYQQVSATYSARAQEIWAQVGVTNPLPQI